MYARVKVNGLTNITLRFFASKPGRAVVYKNNNGIHRKGNYLPRKKRPSVLDTYGRFLHQEGSLEVK